jgi:hypothetical protein
MTARVSPNVAQLFFQELALDTRPLRPQHRIPRVDAMCAGKTENLMKLAKQLGFCVAMTSVCGIHAAHTEEVAVQTKNAALADGQHDFDFEFGNWKAHIKRKTHPVTGGGAWIDYDGTSVVRKVWNGKGNLGELEVDSPSGRLEGLSLRVYNPKSKQWSVYWSNSSDPTIGTPMIGGFSNGRGEFYGQDTVEDRAIYARFIFSGISQTAFSIEQAFSLDGGKTWDPNWIANFKRDPS